MTDEKEKTTPEPQAKAESEAKPASEPGPASASKPSSASKPVTGSKPAPSEPESKPAPRARGGRGNKLRWAKRIILLALLILLVLLLLNWRYCQRGSGSGGLKAADGEKTKGVPAQMKAPAARKAAQAPCQLRVDKKGVSQRGKALSIPEAVKACRGARRAELTVTGDATFGTVKQLREGLQKAGITVVRR